MSTHCHFSECEEKPSTFSTHGRCFVCGETYCPRHVTKMEYAQYLRQVIPITHEGVQGYCVNCVLRHKPEHVKGAIDRKCSRVDCLASLPKMTTVKKLCSYCGRWYCSVHFYTREDLTTELILNLKKFRVIEGAGSCDECLKRDPIGARVVGKKGFFGSRAAEMGERLAEVIEQRLPVIAHSTGESLAKGTVEGIKDQKEEIIEVTQQALDAPVKQRIWATVIGLGGGVVAIGISILYGKMDSGETAGFFHTYRWVSLAILVGIVTLSFLSTAIKTMQAWKAVRAAGKLGETTREVAFSTFQKMMVVNVPILLVVMVLTGVAAYFVLTS